MDIKTATRSALGYLQSGNLKEAAHIFKKILKVQPNNVSALHFTGLICYQQKDYDSAIKYIRKALLFGPDYVDAYNNLGIVLQEIGRLDEAIPCYRKAIQLNPNFDRAYYNLGTALKDTWHIDEAIHQYQKAIQLNPNLFEAYNNLGLAFQDQGRQEDAEAYYRKALQIKPDFALCYSNLLLLMNYNSRHDAQSVFSEHLRFAERIAAPLSFSILPHRNTCAVPRRLRIGYVSPDFRRHSVNYFIEPVLASHNHDQFEIFCYSDVLRPDTVTERLQKYSDHWRSILGLSDEDVSNMIRNDRIDILVDLAGHTGYNRMLVFARKPAPIQITWLGYPNTTGLKNMDYRIVDTHTDPPELTDSFCSEKLIRLPHCFLCYLPDEESPDVKILPVTQNGYITFGSFNYFPKVSVETADAWAAILQSVPDSRLIMKARNFSDSAVCQSAKEMFSQRGISPDRIDLLSIKLSFAEHLDMYNQIDISLDTFPYNGTTTTCESLLMGVPVIALAGDTHASRVSMSILLNIGLPWLVSGNAQEYIGNAILLANDIPKLMVLRKTLRNRMMNSVLCDAGQFTLGLESTYRQIWEEWCMKRTTEKSIFS